MKWRLTKEVGMFNTIARIFTSIAVIMITVPIRLLSGCVAMVDNMLAVFQSTSRSERAYRNAVRFFKKH